MAEKPRLSFWQIWNMSFGFMGIQFGWGLQLANMSGIYTYLGAKPEEVPILWLAGPVTGLLVQPVIEGASWRRPWPAAVRRAGDGWRAALDAHARLRPVASVAPSAAENVAVSARVYRVAARTNPR